MPPVWIPPGGAANGSAAAEGAANGSTIGSGAEPHELVDAEGAESRYEGEVSTGCDDSDVAGVQPEVVDIEEEEAALFINPPVGDCSARGHCCGDDWG